MSEIIAFLIKETIASYLLTSVGAMRGAHPTTFQWYYQCKINVQIKQ